MGALHESERVLRSQSGKKAGKMWVKDTRNEEMCKIPEGIQLVKCLGLKIEMSGVYNQGGVNKVELDHEVLMGKIFF